MNSEALVDAQHEKAFGEHTGIHESVRNFITKIKNNEPRLDFRHLKYGLQEANSGADKFSDLAWELLGRYASSNSHLDDFYMDDLNLTDSQSVLVCRGLENGSSQMKQVGFAGNPIGIAGIRSMGLFLKNCPNLRILSLKNNRHFTTDCFEALLGAMNGRGIDVIYLDSCNIKSIAALGTCSLPKLNHLELQDNRISNISGLENCTQLSVLYLAGNPIGMEGHMTIAKLLANKSSSLYHLSLGATGMGDAEVKLIAESLKRNTTLREIDFYDLYEGRYTREDRNTFTAVGREEFLPLLNDASSIEATYNSNHTLREAYFFTSSEWRANETDVDVEVKAALKINDDEFWRQMRNANGNQKGTLASGRYKVINNQLNSERRKVLCNLQGIEFSFDSMFSEIPSILLPDVLSLVGLSHTTSFIELCLLQLQA
jgi:hypothetical protein